ADAENSDPRFHFPDVRDRQIDRHVCLMIARAAGSALRPECERTCTPPNWTSPPPADSMSRWFRVRSFRAAIVRPVPCNRPFLLSIAAFAAVRSVRDKPLVGTQADLQPPQKPALLPHQANRPGQADDQFLRDAARCARRDRRGRGDGSLRRSTPRSRPAPPRTAERPSARGPFPQPPRPAVG